MKRGRQTLSTVATPPRRASIVVLDHTGRLKHTIMTWSDDAILARRRAKRGRQ